MQTTASILAALLCEKSALGGVYDQQWPAWYARYLVEHGVGPLLDRTVTAEEVAALLAACDAAYRRERPTASWPDFYAHQLLHLHE